MTVSLKHAFTSNVADSSDASLVQPSNWNAEHTLTAGADTLLGAVTAGAVTEITCTSAGRALLDDADAAAQRTTLSAAGTGVTNTFTANQIISVTDNTNAALRVTQLGTGDAILVEDSANPDSSPFVVKADGAVGVKTTAPTEALTVNGNAEITSAGFIKMTGRASNGWLLQSLSSGAASEGGLWRTNGSVALSADNVEASFIADKDNLLRFETSYTERMRITDTGAVGIGTSSPLIASGYAWLTINGPSAGAATSWQTAGTENFRIQSTGLGTYLNNITSVPLLLQTNNLERMRIREDGNVGIGAPGVNYSKLMIKNDRAVSAYSLILDNYNGVNFENSFVLQYDSTGTQFVGNYQAANLAFLTNNIERMRVRSDGLIQFATTTVASGRLNVSGYTNGGAYGMMMRPTADGATPMAFMNAAGTIVGTISTNATATAFTSTSDYRLKNDICPIGYPIKRLSSLRPVNFKWNSTGERMDGFLAHEVQGIVPEAVNGEKDAVGKDGKPVYQSIDQARLMPLVVSALQETINRLELLEAKHEKS